MKSVVGADIFSCFRLLVIDKTYMLYTDYVCFAVETYILHSCLRKLYCLIFRRTALVTSLKMINVKNLAV